MLLNSLFTDKLLLLLNRLNLLLNGLSLLLHKLSLWNRLLLNWLLLNWLLLDWLLLDWLLLDRLLLRLNRLLLRLKRLLLLNRLKLWLLSRLTLKNLLWLWLRLQLRLSLSLWYLLLRVRSWPLLTIRQPRLLPSISALRHYPIHIRGGRRGSTTEFWLLLLWVGLLMGLLCLLLLLLVLGIRACGSGVGIVAWLLVKVGVPAVCLGPSTPSCSRT